MRQLGDKIHFEAVSVAQKSTPRESREGFLYLCLHPNTSTTAHKPIRRGSVYSVYRSPFGQLGSTQDGPTQLLQVAYVNIVEVSSSLKESHTRTVTHGGGVSRDGRPRVLPYSGSYRNRQSNSGSALLSDRRVFSTLL